MANTVNKFKLRPLRISATNNAGPLSDKVDFGITPKFG